MPTMSHTGKVKVTSPQSASIRTQLCDKRVQSYRSLHGLMLAVRYCVVLWTVDYCSAVTFSVVTVVSNYVFW